jgi:hypothetical protein
MRKSSTTRVFPKILSLGALCGVIAIWVLLRVLTPSELQRSESVETQFVETPRPLSIPEQQLLVVPESSPTESKLASAEGLEVEDEAITTDACAELAQFPNLTVNLAPEKDVDNDRCARLLAFQKPQVPALPGLSGFEVRDFPFSPRTLLIEEQDRPEWSREMEGRIFAEIDRLLDFPIPVVHVVCKSATCGLLFTYDTRSYSGGRRIEWAKLLADTLGFTGYESGEAAIRATSMQFTYIYLGAWDTPRTDSDTPAHNLLTSFEEILVETEVGR